MGRLLLPNLADGKKRFHDLYRNSKAKCEEKLKQLIVEMKAEIAEAQRLKDLGEGNGWPSKEKRQAPEEE